MYMIISKNLFQHSTNLQLHHSFSRRVIKLTFSTKPAAAYNSRNNLVAAYRNPTWQSNNNKCNWFRNSNKTNVKKIQIM